MVFNIYEMKNILLITLLFFGISLNSQTVIPIYGHGKVNPEFPVYVVDNLVINRKLVSSILIERQDIKQVKVLARDNRIVFTTKLLFVLNGKMLLGHKEKEVLSTVNQDNIVSIYRLNSIDAKKLYGKKGKRGAIILMTK